MNVTQSGIGGIDCQSAKLGLDNFSDINRGIYIAWKQEY